MTKLLYRAIVRPFYKAHTGFFFALIFIGVGFLRGSEHIAIAHYIAESITFTLILLVILSLYIIKVYSFVITLLRKEQYKFIYHLALYPKWRQFIQIASIQLSMSQLVVLYGGFVGWFMWQASAYLNLALLTLFIIAIIAGSSLLYLYKLARPITESRGWAWQRLIDFKFIKPHFMWYPIYLFKERPMLWILSKVMSVAFILGFYALYASDEYDWRVLGVGLVLASSANIMLSLESVNFRRTVLFYNNLGFTFSQRMTHQFFAFIILSLPELILISYHHPSDQPVYFLLSSAAFFVVTFVFYAALANYIKAETDRMPKFGFYITMALFFLTLFGLPMVITTFILLIIAGLMNYNQQHLIWEN